MSLQRDSYSWERQACRGNELLSRKKGCSIKKSTVTLHFSFLCRPHKIVIYSRERFNLVRRRYKSLSRGNDMKKGRVQLKWNYIGKRVML